MCRSSTELCAELDSKINAVMEEKEEEEERKGREKGLSTRGHGGLCW